ncbi:MAG: hypothetical protein IJJ63_00465 [Bacilli bacterium]|nr:hypothetical protein [Bacilli bacterium]
MWKGDELMGAREAMEHRMLQNGMKFISVTSSLTMGSAHDEWLRWLEYIPREQKEKYDRLKLKGNSLTKGEKRWLNQIELEARVASYIRSTEKLTYEQAYELKKYMDKASIDRLIARKLTNEEYALGQKIAYNIIEEFGEYDLEDLYHEVMEYYDDLDMVQTFAFREFGKVAINRSCERKAKMLAKQIRDNDAMRARSIIEAGKRIVR